MTPVRNVPVFSRIPKTQRRRLLMALYKTLLAHFGPQKWWPGRTRFEVIVGAILTQNTAWRNVERAIANLRAAGLLVPEKLRRIKRARLAKLIRSAGYFNVKAERLGAFLDWFFGAYGGDLRRMDRTPTMVLREELLAVRGVGRETADSILLYALKRPVFVIDAYTRRIVRRHGLAAGDEDYDELRALFEDNLPRQVQLYNEYHALIVAAGKNHCGPKTRCDGCPLEAFPHIKEP